MNQKEFNVSCKQLAEAHGINEVTVNSWANSGAFPFMRTNPRESKRVHRLFHEDAVKLTLGEIKANRASGKYVEPVLYAEDFEKGQTQTKKVFGKKQLKAIASQVHNIEIKIDLICEKLGITLEE